MPTSLQTSTAAHLSNFGKVWASRSSYHSLSSVSGCHKGCDNSGREQLDAQGWDVQQAGLREGAAGQGQQAPGTKLHDPASDVIQQRWRESGRSKKAVRVRFR
ncbi:hypothetical protein HaLaN_08765 [Haematococcus lacustris]|uniref:Uncharacterized protein n=1 Tax=Haematococcus lacustris TaxID=44745 RepID=A0A699YRZ6_HAELA|nr:hypothetical protein HaLaN_08765 [Haematococcus lacustris]